jgi:hypothetical protein
MTDSSNETSLESEMEQGEVIESLIEHPDSGKNK